MVDWAQLLLPLRKISLEAAKLGTQSTFIVPQGRESAGTTINRGKENSSLFKGREKEEEEFSLIHGWLFPARARKTMKSQSSNPDRPTILLYTVLGLVWITLGFSLVLPLLLGLDA